MSLSDDPEGLKEQVYALRGPRFLSGACGRAGPRDPSFAFQAGEPL